MMIKKCYSRKFRIIIIINITMRAKTIFFEKRGRLVNLQNLLFRTSYQISQVKLPIKYFAIQSKSNLITPPNTYLRSINSSSQNFLPVSLPISWLINFVTRAHHSKVDTIHQNTHFQTED